MSIHKKPDICFDEKSSKTFSFINNVYELNLNEVYDKSFYVCLNTKIDTQTTLIINTDKNSNKNIISYVVLNDIRNIENIIIKSADNINLIWKEGTGTIYSNKNYIIQFTQINKTTVIASLTNTTLIGKGGGYEPEPSPLKELSAIYFAMPNEGTSLYEAFNWWNEKKYIEPAAATAHSEDVKFVIPQNINGKIIWTSFKNYSISNNLIKVPLENIYEEYFLNAVKDNNKAFFKLRTSYECSLASNQRIEIDYPLIWDKDYNKTGWCRIVLR